MQANAALTQQQKIMVRLSGLAKALQVINLKGDTLISEKDTGRLVAHNDPDVSNAAITVEEAAAELRRLVGVSPVIQLADELAQTKAELEAVQKELQALKDQMSLSPEAVAGAVDDLLPTPDANRVQELEAQVAQLQADLETAGYETTEQTHVLYNFKRLFAAGDFFAPAQSRIVLSGLYNRQRTISTQHATMTTDVGTNREKNEDAALCAILADGREVYIVCDGMGGHEAGDYASLAAAEGILFALESGLSLAQAVSTANLLTAICAPSAGSGTTLVVAIVDRHNNTLETAQVGDSRIKLVGERSSQHLSLDHKLKFYNLFNRDIDPKAKPSLPTDEATIIELDNEEFEAKNVILSALGTVNAKSDGSVARPSTNLLAINLQPSTERHFLLLYSDGAIDNVSETELTRIAQEQGLTHEQVALKIRDRALQNSADNITVIVVELPFEIKTSLTNTTMPLAVDFRRQPPPPPPPPPPALDPLAEGFKGLEDGPRQWLLQQYQLTQSTWEQVISKPVGEQLQLIHQGILSSKVKAELFAKIPENRLDDLIATWDNQKENQEIRGLALKILFSYLEKLMNEGIKINNIVGAAQKIRKQLHLNKVLATYIKAYEGSGTLLYNTALQIKQAKLGW